MWCNWVSEPIQPATCHTFLPRTENFAHHREARELHSPHRRYLSHKLIASEKPEALEFERFVINYVLYTKSRKLRSTLAPTKQTSILDLTCLIELAHLVIRTDKSDLDGSGKCKDQCATGENKWLSETRKALVSLERYHVDWLSQFWIPSRRVLGPNTRA